MILVIFCMIAVIAGDRRCMMMIVMLMKWMMMKRTRRMRRILPVHDSCDGSEPQVHDAPGNPFSRLSSNPPAQTWAQGTPLKVKSQETFEG